MDTVINSFVEKSKEILQDNLVGVYLHGSAVMGCYNPAKSDIDLIVVVKDSIEDKDLAAHFTIINYRGKCLYGASITDIFADVPVQDYIDSIWNDIAEAEEEITDNPMYIILNLARVFAYVKDGLVLSKKEGGEWALNHVHERYHSLIQDALTEYAEDSNKSYDTNLAKDYAKYMVREIASEKKVG